MALRQLTTSVSGTLRQAAKTSGTRTFVTTVAPQPKVLPAAVSDKIPHKGDYSREKCDLRREWAEQYTGVPLPDVATWWQNDELSPEILQGNIELPIGTTSLPLGVAGPLLLRGDKAQGTFVAPIAATHKNLVADLTRGALALTNSGGVRTSSAQQRMTRCPAMQTGSPEQAVMLGEWAKTQIDKIQTEVVSKLSRVAVLKELMTIYDLENVSLLMYYETGDAAGQNVTSTASFAAAQWIADNAPKEIDVQRVWVEGNLSGDKKCSHLNALFGRGLHVGAQVTIPESVLQKDLGVTGQEVADYYQVMCRMTERSHVLGVNLSVASLIAGIFPAIGQDLGSILDSSMSRVQFDRNYGPEGGVKASLIIPSLVIGTVGGGTNLPTQKEGLDIMGCHGAGKVGKLGEIIAGFALALDLAHVADLAKSEKI